MIKIPGTDEGVPAIEQPIYEGMQRQRHAAVRRRGLRRGSPRPTSAAWSAATPRARRSTSTPSRRSSSRASTPRSTSAWRRSAASDLQGQRRPRQRARRLPALQGDLPRRALRAPARGRRAGAAPAVGVDRRQEPRLPRHDVRRRARSRRDTVNTMPMATLHGRGRPRRGHAARPPTRTRRDDLRRSPRPASTSTTSPTSCCATASTRSSRRWRSCWRGIESKREAIVTAPPAGRSSRRSPTSSSRRSRARIERGRRGRGRAAHLAQGRRRSGARRASRRSADRLGWLTVTEQLRGRGRRPRRPSPQRGRAPTGDAGRRAAGHGRLVAGARGPAPVASAAPTGCPRLHVLDSTDPDAVRDVEDADRPADDAASSSPRSRAGRSRRSRSSSTSGRVRPDGAAVRRDHRPGLGARRSSPSEHGFRRVFLNDPDIGGRYSALSSFGHRARGAHGRRRARAARRRRRRPSRPAPRYDARQANSGLWLGCALGELAAAAAATS